MIYQLMSVRTLTSDMRLSSISKIVLRLAFPVKMSKDLSIHFAQIIPIVSFSSVLSDPPPPDHSTDLHLLEEDTGLVRALELKDKLSKFIPLYF